MDAGDETSEAGMLPVGAELFAAIHGNETRVLNGKREPVIVFSVGADGKGLYWLPRRVFDSCTEWFDPKKRTSILFTN